MFCHHCGTQVAGDATFCPNCGRAVGEAALPGSAAAGPWAPPAGVRAHTGRWIGAGWELVKADLWTYVLLALVSIVISGVVPIVLQGAMIAGFHIFTMKKLTGRRAELADLFAGFNFFVPALVTTLLIAVFTTVGTLLCIIPGLVVAAVYKFTYLFIVDKRMDFWPAMQASHAVTKQDYFGFTMFLLALIGVNVLGLLCCVVGLLVTVPITYAAITVAYRDTVGFDPATANTL